MLVRFSALLGTALLFHSVQAEEPLTGREVPTRAEVLETMQRATRFMVGTVSVRGGYVWSYLDDFSRRWGEIEARPTMIWIQSPGTPDVGQTFLDAWEASGDELFHDAARRAGQALIDGQLSCGGWNYVIDFAGEDSLREWYATVGRNAWRLEEFQHYFGNATYDDGTTASATQFLLRLYLAKRDPVVKAALDRAIEFILKSQHPSGAWPQRFPPASEADHSETARYSSYLTLNDDVSLGNIETLLACHRALGGERLLEAVERGRLAFVRLQIAEPQPGWALQYTPELEPAGARTYEPKAVATHATARSIESLLQFHRATHDPRFLAPIPRALAWLESCRLPQPTPEGGTHPTFIELGTGRALYLHRSGSNVANGRYFADADPTKTVGHYSSYRSIDLARLRASYEAAVAAARDGHATSDSSASRAGNDETSEDNAGANSADPAVRRRARGANVTRVIRELDASGRWITRLRNTSHPYRGESTAAPVEGDFARGFVGDDSDTSPFAETGQVNGISTRVFIQNMATLTAALRAAKTPENSTVSQDRSAP